MKPLTLTPIGVVNVLCRAAKRSGKKDEEIARHLVTIAKAVYDMSDVTGTNSKSEREHEEDAYVLNLISALDEIQTDYVAKIFEETQENKSVVTACSEQSCG